MPIGKIKFMFTIINFFSFGCNCISIFSIFCSSSHYLTSNKNYILHGRGSLASFALFPNKNL